MSFFGAVRHRLRVLLRPAAYQRELDEEFRFHLALDAMQQQHASQSPDGSAARMEAQRRFGNVTSMKEETRHMAGLGFFDVLRQDLGFALRTLRRAPGFTAVAILTLAFGIGANTAIFSAVDAMLLRALPFRDPDELMKVSIVRPPHGDRPGSDEGVWSYLKFAVVRDAQKDFTGLGISAEDQATITGGGDAERTTGEIVNAEYLPTLGVQLILGRGISSDEERNKGAEPVVLIGEMLWQRRFNADPAVRGKALVIDGKPYTIIGVVPAGFRGLSGRAEWWVPVGARYPEILLPEEAWDHMFWLTARRKPGVTIAQAKAAVQVLGARMNQAYPDPRYSGGPGEGAIARELDATRVDPVVRRSLLVLLGAVGLVLLIACANVANLFLVRAASRSREIAVRLAVGAGRKRLVRQLLTESLLLSLLGGVASIAIAWAGVRLLSSLNPASALRSQGIEGLGAVTFSSIHLDLTAFGFAAALALATGILFGLVPAIQATRPSLTSALKEGTPPTRTLGGLRWPGSRSVLAAVEIALALVLLAGSGLMLRSLANLLSVEPGFDPDRMLSLRLNLPGRASRDSMPGFYDQVIERLGALPGVTGVAIGNCPPLSGGCNGTVVDLRDRPPAKEGSEPTAGVQWITPSWPAVMRVPLEKGRVFNSSDRLGTRKAVLVSHTAAQKFWPGEDPIGRPIGVGQGGFWKDTAYVAGVIGDVRYGTLDSLPGAEVYLPYAQSPSSRMMIFVRTAGDPLSVAGTVRAALRELAPDLPVYDMRTMSSRVADAAARARQGAVLLALFAGMALVLATMGIYSVISFAVTQRTREIGIRVALGATRGEVLRLVVGQGTVLAVVGGVLGLGAAFLATRVLQSLLFGIQPLDPVTFGAVVALLGVAAVLASWIPARRAAGVDPVVALREG